MNLMFMILIWYTTSLNIACHLISCAGLIKFLTHTCAMCFCSTNISVEMQRKRSNEEASFRQLIFTHCMLRDNMLWSGKGCRGPRTWHLMSSRPINSNHCKFSTDSSAFLRVLYTTVGFYINMHIILHNWDSPYSPPISVWHVNKFYRRHVLSLGN